MKRYITAAVVVFAILFAGCGQQDDKYTSTCKDIGNHGADLTNCITNMKKMEKELKNLPEPQ